MAKGNNTNSSKPAQVTVILRLIAGGYLVYLAYGLLQEYQKPVGGGQLLQIGAAILFFSFGVVIAGWSVLKFAKGDYIRYGQVMDDEEDEEPESPVITKPADSLETGPEDDDRS